MKISALNDICTIWPSHPNLGKARVPSHSRSIWPQRSISKLTILYDSSDSLRFLFQLPQSLLYRPTHSSGSTMWGKSKLPSKSSFSWTITLSGPSKSPSFLQFTSLATTVKMVQIQIIYFNVWDSDGNKVLRWKPLYCLFLFIELYT